LAQVAEVRLGRQRAPQYEHGDHLIPYLRSANVVDGGLDLTDVKSMNFEPAEQAIFGLSDGDVLMTEGSGSAETVGTSAVWCGELPGTVCFQNTLLRLRPRSGVTDGRFLAWWARHAHASGQIAAVSSGANIQHIGSDGLKDLKIHVPDLHEQRRIADFLDDRVARIDQIIVARLGQVDLFSEWISSSVNGLLAPDGVPGRWLRIKDVASKVGSGKTPRGGADAYVEEGVAFLRSQNVHNDGLRLDDVAFISEDLDEEMSGTRVRGGDVLLNITGGSLGRCCVADETALPANVSQHVCIIRPTRIDPSNLALLLRSKVVQDQVRLAQVGGNREGLNFEQVRELRFWHPEDPRVWSLCRSREEQGLKGAAIIRSSVSVLQTYKQSLITAAVTGEIDVTTAGCGIPG
jgi:type I restriction enzyme, S subunit